jgi:hypothetical protein
MVYSLSRSTDLAKVLRLYESMRLEQTVSTFIPIHSHQTHLRRMAKQETYTFAIMRAPACLRQCGTNINCLQFWTPLLLLRMGHRIRNHNLRERPFVNRLDRIAREYAMSHNGHDFLSAVCHDGVRGFDKRATGVCNVIDQNRYAVAYIAN